MSSSLVSTLALLLTAAGVLCFLPAVLRRAPWGVSLGMMLDLWTAAALLQLALAHTSWRALLIPALFIALRRLITWSLRTGPWSRLRAPLRGSRARDA